MGVNGEQILERGLGEPRRAALHATQRQQVLMTQMFQTMSERRVGEGNEDPRRGIKCAAKPMALLRSTACQEGVG